jgi:hypothetical protein
MNRLLAVAILCVSTGCGGDDNHSVDEHQSAWEAKRPAEYVIGVCGTGLSRGCTLSAVANDQVVAARSKVGNDAWTDSEVTEGEDPVSALFRGARAKEDCDRTRLAFDERYGFVSDVYFDCGEEGYGTRVSCFAAGTTDFAECVEP